MPGACSSLDAIRFTWVPQGEQNFSDGGPAPRSLHIIFEAEHIQLQGSVEAGFFITVLFFYSTVPDYVFIGGNVYYRVEFLVIMNIVLCCP